MTERRDEAGSWRWKPAEVGEAEEPWELLLYEPGNWGDVLKGAWTTLVVAHLLGRPDSGKSLHYVDPFCGAPSYALPAPSRGRFESLEGTAVQGELSPFLVEGRWPSTASMVARSCGRHGAVFQPTLFDADAERRRAWKRQGIEPARGIRSGEELLDRLEASEDRADLVLMDPYDFFDHWGTWLPRVQRLALEVPVIAYLHDKSWRGAGHEDQYRRFRRRLEPTPGAPGFLLGRLPSDVRSPRSCHEVLLVGDRALLRALSEPLQRESEALARILGCDRPFVAFEAKMDGEGTP